MNALLARPELQDHPFLRNAPAEFLNQLAPFETEVDFAAGETILQEDHYADRLYLIVEGDVALEVGITGKRIDTIGAGEVLGWSWLYPPYVSRFTARAVTAVHALELNGPALLVLAEEDHSFGYELMKRITACTIRRLDCLRKRVCLTMRREPDREMKNAFPNRPTRC